MYRTPQNKFEIVIGSNNNAEAKIAGITPAINFKW